MLKVFKKLYNYFKEPFDNKRLNILTCIYLLAGVTIVAAAATTIDRSIDSTLSTTYTITEYTKPTEHKIIETILIDSPIVFEECVYEEQFDINKSTELLANTEAYIKNIEDAILSSAYTDEAVIIMKNEIARLTSVANLFKLDINKYTKWESEYYYAAKTYEFFRQHGYSEEVTCGIIGNMMMETSGGTLSLKPFIHGKGHYGLCQWSLYYKPFMSNVSFEYQLEFLLEDIPVEFSTFGFVYKKNFTYEDFLLLQTPEDAAVAFVKVYERPGDNSTYARKRAARVAYDYFTSKETN